MQVARSLVDHPKVRPFTAGVARELGVPTDFARFVLSRYRMRCFDRRCEEARFGHTTSVPVGVRAVYPLWSFNGDHTLLVRTATSCWYAESSRGTSELEHVADTAQGLLADLFLELWDDMERLPVLVAAARSCGFGFLHEVIDFQRAYSNEPQRWWAYRQRFIAAVDRRVQRAISSVHYL